MANKQLSNKGVNEGGAQSLMSKGATAKNHLDAMISFVTCFSASDYQDLMKHCDGDIDLQIQGVPSMKISEMMSMFKNVLVPSFPDLHSKIIPSTYMENGSTICFEIETTGTFTGAPYSPGFNLPPINKTNKLISNGAESVMLKLNKNSNKVSLMMKSESDDGQLGGLLGFYIRAGGQLPRNFNPMMQVGGLNQLSQGQGDNSKMMETIQEAYKLFAKGEIPTLLQKYVHPDVEWIFGDPQSAKDGHRSLPWNGCHKGQQAVGEAFGRYGALLETLSFVPVDISVINRNTAHTNVRISMRNRKTGKEGAVMLLHVVQLTDDCEKWIKFQDYQDSGYTQTLL